MRFDPDSRNGRRVRASTGRRIIDSGKLREWLGYAVTPRLLVEIASWASSVFREEAARDFIDASEWSVEIWNPDDILITKTALLILVGPDRIGYSLDPSECMAEQRDASKELGR